jgi:hypothetical protein
MSAADRFRWAGIVAEGASDAICGRPRTQNPYAPDCGDAYAAWELGWVYGRGYLDAHAQAEAQRWLREAA